MEWQNKELNRLDKEIENIYKEIEILSKEENRNIYELAKRFFDARRKRKEGSRLFICEDKIRNILDEEFSIETTFEDRISDKLLYKGITREEAIWDIIKTSCKENEDIPTYLILSNPATYRRIE